MNNTIGKRVELLIFDKGFSSIRKFAEYMKECNPQNYVSEDTISNVIKGKGAQNNTLVIIAQGLGIPVECLTNENLPLVDQYLLDEVEPMKEAIDRDGMLNEEYEINELETVKSLYDLSKRIYPDSIGKMYNEYGYNITTLAELSIYFPLCRMENILEVMYRICGQIEHYESYILDQYRWLYGTIPDIPAKKYADYQAIKLRLANKRYLTEKEQELQSIVYEFKKTELYHEGCEQYKRIIKEAYKLYYDDVVKDIFKIRLPELLK